MRALHKFPRRTLSGEPMVASRIYQRTMITNDDRAVLVLNSLIRAGRDAEQGYLMAADGVAEPELVQLFAEYAVQRTKFVAELQERVKALRAEPENIGSVAGDAHQIWMGLKTAIEANEAHGILAECERGEDATVKAYRTALGERDVDKQTRDMIQRQYEFVQAAHDRVRQLRDSARYAHR